MEDLSLGNKKIALALGSGSARGMAHIGVIQRLQELGIQPDIICGTSIGSVIAGCYLTGKLEHFTDWIQSLSTTQVLHYMSVSLTVTGGVAHATRLIEFFENEYGNPDIETLTTPFAAVATDLMRGREVWLQRGPLWDAVRASMAIPGILTPVAFGNSWLVDGGLVNPVPVSVCRALGADIIIGVDLNSDLVGRQKVVTDAKAPTNEESIEEEESEDEELIVNEDSEDDPSLSAAFSRFTSSIKEAANSFRNTSETQKQPEPPGTVGVMMSAINIMQDRITRSRLAGEPADIMLWPRLGHIGLLEFSSAAEAIIEGRNAVDRMLPAIRHAFKSEGDDRFIEPHY
ncbi:putative NTE family protein [Zhongshania aliphaticivorans]|uniref:Putative NTE family protein n=1 Tax=Zhongshania aliphaticivorans TaxID=1470434 RepID=A0A5S9NL66_9GAMM|nr:patatin-like phospholipase family protein [Zhongshania aliphaticivorans]CAA0091484.1 putative NTE family protein [Zhongshania aliphaticivorans]CAA0098854.1 putative NTE family protein [Zhongshania aliphaticivorans]